MVRINMNSEKGQTLIELVMMLLALDLVPIALAFALQYFGINKYRAFAVALVPTFAFLFIALAVTPAYFAFHYRIRADETEILDPKRVSYLIGSGTLHHTGAREQKSEHASLLSASPGALEFFTRSVNPSLDLIYSLVRCGEYKTF
jgi:hypothetical protein